MTQSDPTGSGWTNSYAASGAAAISESIALDPVEILDTIDVPIIVVQRDFTIARFNSAAAERLSVAGSDIGRSARDVAGLAQLQDLERWCAQAISAESPSRHDFRYKDQTFVLRIAPYAKRSREMYGTVLTFMNVTAFRASIDEAIYEREYTKAVLNAGNDPIVVLSQDQCLQTANRAFYVMFGVTRETLQNTSLQSLRDGALDLPRFRSQLQKTLDEGSEFQPFEVELDLPGIGHRTLVLDARPFSLSDNSRRMILLSFHDITVRKEAEAKLRAADRAKDEFLAMLGHELRNPLGALASAVQILDLKERSADHVERARAVIGRQLDHLMHLVDDLLDASRVTRTKMRLSTRPLELCQAVRATIEALRLRGALDNHQLTFDGQQVWVDADETRIEQIVTNLVGNALKFTPPGGMVNVTMRSGGQRALLAVEDTGVGIAAEVLPTIFDLFVQSDRSLDRSQGGLGVGLTLVRRLVELHGGTVKAASKGPGMGSSFTVDLPAIPAPKANADEPIPVKEAATRPRRVLIVDDNDDFREMLSIVLTQDGHEVHLAKDGPSGLQAALTFQADVGLIDLGLPGFDGHALARSIRDHDESRQIYLVALTGYGQPDDRLRSKEAGFDDHVVKPLDLKQLTALLQRANRR
jgi:two-component system CheB/CheR fusion protein